jgi:hypothetical protein
MLPSPAVSRARTRPVGCLVASLVTSLASFALAAPPPADAPPPAAAASDAPPAASGTAAAAPLAPSTSDDPVLGAYADVPRAPRPPPLTAPLEVEHPRSSRRVDVGVFALVVSRITDEGDEGVGKGVTYDTGPGIGVTARVQIVKYFQVEAAFGWATHAVTYDEGSLGVDGTLTSDFVTSSWLDARLLPTLPLGDRVRLFGAVGIGWGRVELPPAQARDASGAYWVRDRAASFFEIPLGVGGSVELIPGWLSLDAEMLAAPTFSEDGSAYIPVQSLDGAGKKHEIGALPRFPVTLVQSFGLSLLL